MHNLWYVIYCDILPIHNITTHVWSVKYKKLMILLLTTKREDSKYTNVAVKISEIEEFPSSFHLFRSKFLLTSALSLIDYYYDFMFKMASKSHYFTYHNSGFISYPVFNVIYHCYITCSTLVLWSCHATLKSKTWFDIVWTEWLVVVATQVRQHARLEMTIHN